MTERYIVSDDCEHSCCNEASVVDRAMYRPYSNPPEFREVCECLHKDDAIAIAKALNEAKP